MPSTPRRKPVSYHRAAPLFGLAAPLLALLCGACLNAPAGDSDSTGTDGSSGDVSSTLAPTTGDDTGAPTLNEGRYFLRIDDEPVPPVVLEMDKAKVIEVFGDTALKQITLLEVDSTPLLLNVLDQIQNACGNKWQLDSEDPLHDCQNPQYFDPDVNDADNVVDIKAKYDQLGKTFGPAWKTSAEYAMVRLLSMTPANANVNGTSLQLMAQAFAENPNLFKIGFSELLAKSLGVSVTQTFIPQQELVLALQHTLLASHPAVSNPEGKLPVTLYDAVHDMQPLSTKLGPAGDHPGILLPDDENFTTTSDALTPAFRMKAIAESNLRLVNGVDASVGAGAMFVSLAASPLKFDFLDPEKVQMLGIADAPTVDMRMSITELDAVVPPCTTTDACKTNYPNSPVGLDHIWSTPDWSLEKIVGTAGYTSYQNRTYEECIFKLNGGCPVGVWVGPNEIIYPPPAAEGPIGWTQFKFFDVQVPDAQFLWELLIEIAQVAIHDPAGDNDYDSPNVNRANDIAEGAARPIFALKGVPIGLTAEQMIAQIRPNLQAQAEFIAKTILGKFWKHNDHLDFYYRRGSDGGAPILFFVAETDLRPDPSDPEQLAAYTYAKPGFFADAALTAKLSSTTLAGVPEADHEKLALSPGESTVYMQDDAGDTYALRFYVPPGADPTEIVVHVRPV